MKPCRKDEWVYMSPSRIRKSTRTWMKKHIADMLMKHGTPKKMFEAVGYKDLGSLVCRAIEEFRIRNPR